jgi:hypothetical protein
VGSQVAIRRDEGPHVPDKYGIARITRLWYGPRCEPNSLPGHRIGPHSGPYMGPMIWAIPYNSVAAGSERLLAR